MLQKFLLSIIFFAVTAIPVMAQNAPEACYLVGSYNDWTTPDATDLSTLHTLTDEDADGIYYGKFNLGVDDFNFKVFIAVTNWNDGIQYFGTDKEISWATINTEKYTAVFENSGNIQCPDWEGGEIEMYYDYANNLFWFEVERPCIYMNITELSNPEDLAGEAILFQTDKENYYTTTINFSANDVISFNFMSDLDYTEVYTPEEKIDVNFEINDEYANFTGAFISTTEKSDNCWTIKEFPGGKITFVVDTQSKTVSLSYKIPQTKPEDCIYLVGAPSGWVEPSEANSEHYLNYCLIPDENGVYSGVFDVTGQLMFRVYSKLTGWDGGDSYGSQVNDNPIDVALTDGVYQGEVVKGKGSWNFPDWQGGKVKISVDMQAMTISVNEIIDDPVYESFVNISPLVVSDLTDTSAKISFTITTSEDLIGNNATLYLNDESIDYFVIETTAIDREHIFEGLQPGESQNVSIYVTVGELTSNKESVVFTTTSGIDGINADDNAPVEYFNMQGIRVANPENGLFIRRQGGKIEKVFLNK